MSKKRKRIDHNQLSLDFEQRVAQYQALKEEILDRKDRAPKSTESQEEVCIQLAAAIKQAIRNTNLSREQVVDRINAYFGWKKGSKAALSIHMFNHYLSKPAKYPIPAYYIFAIQNITGSLAPAQAFVDAADARIISGDEVRQMAMGKLDDALKEIRRLKKELGK